MCISLADVYTIIRWCIHHRQMPCTALRYDVKLPNCVPPAGDAYAISRWYIHKKQMKCAPGVGRDAHHQQVTSTRQWVKRIPSTGEVYNRSRWDVCHQKVMSTHYSICICTTDSWYIHQIQMTCMTPACEAYTIRLWRVHHRQRVECITSAGDLFIR